MASHHGQPSCTAVSLGKNMMRRALRAATGKQKKAKKKKKQSSSSSSCSVSLERMSSLSAPGNDAKDSVVRVVLRGGVVEAYRGVVLACTVIRQHPPGLCLAHPDVFRNPHGAVVRPLEPLFPGQKFLLLPETTVVRLKHKIPESSIGAACADHDDFEEEEEEEEDGNYSSSDDNDGNAAASSSEDEVSSDESGYFLDGCSAREFYVANDRWSHCQFQKLVHSGLAVEQQQQSPPPNQPDRRRKKKKGNTNKKRRRKARRDRRRVAAPAGFRSSTTVARAWEPSLPSVEEEEEEEEEACSDCRLTTHLCGHHDEQ